jgi:hypothetical protein
MPEVKPPMGHGCISPPCLKVRPSQPRCNLRTVQEAATAQRASLRMRAIVTLKNSRGCVRQLQIVRFWTSNTQRALEEDAGAPAGVNCFAAVLALTGSVLLKPSVEFVWSPLPRLQPAITSALASRKSGLAFMNTLIGSGGESFPKPPRRQGSRPIALSSCPRTVDRAA